MNVEQKHISFLLGAGFSAPMGYPVGNGMNQKFLEFDKYFVDPLDGHIKDSYIDPYPNDHYEMAKRFCKKAIGFYFSKNGCFDYELFYDIIKDDLLFDDNNSDYQRIALSVDPQGAKNKWFQLRGDVEVLYDRLVAFFIKDSKQRQWYQGNERLEDDETERYKTFFKTLNLLSDNNIVHLHTLNHDLLLEAFNAIHSNILRKSISDGFSIKNTNYGTVCRNQNVTQRVALEEYTGEYHSNIRLYKLHGSLNYWRFFGNKRGIAEPERMLKLKRDESSTELFRIDPVTHKLEPWPFEYNPSFLVGAVMKERQYNKFFFNELFPRFMENLKYSEKLVVVGYGFKDEGINRIIEDCFDYKNKPVIVIDPAVNTNKTISAMAERWNAFCVEKSITEIEVEDLV